MNTTTEYLDRWRASGLISGAQHEALSRVARRERVSIFVELNSLLYIGVLALAGGLAWTAREYAARWGDAAIVAPLTLLLAACAYYCLTRVPPYSHERVEPPGLAFDYVLYLGCLAVAVDVGYLEYRFHLLQERWDYYLLFSSTLYLLLAYRFDNRFVLSLAVATLGSWFGVRLSYLPIFEMETVRLAALAYALTLAALGAGLYRAAIKRHFLETYLHIAVNVWLAALMTGIAMARGPSVWTVALLASAGVTVYAGVQYRWFAFVVYGVVYGYIGVSRELLRTVGSTTSALAYLVLSSALVIVGLVVLSRNVGREE